MAHTIYKSQTIADQVFNLKNVFDLQKDMLGFIRKVAATPGRMIQFRLGHETAFLLKDPDDIRTVLVKKNKDFDKSTPGYEGLRAYLGQGLLSSNSDSWNLHRRIAQPFFHPNKMEDYFTSFRLQVNDKIAKALAYGSTTVDLSMWMSSVTLAILGDTLLDFNMDADSGKLAQSINCIFAMTAKKMYSPIRLPLAIPTKSHCIFAAAQKTILEIILNLIDKNRQQKVAKLSYVKELMNHRTDNGKALQFQEIFDEIITMIQAGHETSTNALIWSMLRLYENPEAYQKLKAEMLALPANYQLTALDTAPYLNAVIYESMRLDPPAWAFDRRALTDVDLKCGKIKKGQIVVLSPMIAHRLAEFWTKPDAFIPERFLATDPYANPAYFPFGLGPRVCIGQRFAMVEMKTVLAEIFRQSNYNIADTKNIQREGSITLRPKDPVLCTF